MLKVLVKFMFSITLYTTLLTQNYDKEFLNKFPFYV